MLSIPKCLRHDGFKTKEEAAAATAPHSRLWLAPPLLRMTTAAVQRRRRWSDRLSRSGADIAVQRPSPIRRLRTLKRPLLLYTEANGKADTARSRPPPPSPMRKAFFFLAPPDTVCGTTGSSAPYMHLE